MAENYCDFAQWEGKIIGEQPCGDNYTLPNGDEIPGCTINWFEPNQTKPDDAYPQKFYKDGAWEVYFEDSPRVLHAWDYTHCMKPHVNISRVVECRCNICGPADDRFEYAWPQGCPVTILPPGRYRIRVPKQRVYNMEEGEDAVVSVLLEVVGEQYVQALGAMSPGNSCGAPAATINNCCG